MLLEEMPLTVVDLFAGAGGLDEGFAKVGFDVVAHVEKEKWMCETLKTWDIFHFLEGQNQLPIY
jgi:DNA (cytosine-5)-methyltransferase 1